MSNAIFEVLADVPTMSDVALEEETSELDLCHACGPPVLNDHVPALQDCQDDA